MSKTLKVIFGVLIALLVVGAAVVIVWLVWSGFGRPAWMMGAPDWRYWDGGRDLPRDQYPWRGMPMHPYSRLPGVLLPWMPFGGIIGGLLCLGTLALIILGLVALVTSLFRSPKSASVSAPGGAASAVVEAKPMPASERVCPSCARAVQDDWSHCPYCGSELG